MDERGAPAWRGARRALPLVALLALLLPARISRAGYEGSLWIDETFSLVCASQPPSRIVDFAAIDTNPPGYFLALKAWLKGGALLGRTGILWARLLGVAAWIALAAIAGWSGGKLLGPSGGALAAWAVAGSAYAALLAKDARGYALASVALFACFVLLLLLDRPTEPPRRRAVTFGLWLLYALAATIALWTHLLSAIALLLLALLWLALALVRRPPTAGFLTGGALAQSLVALAFLPWLLHLRAQVASLDKSAPTWMTPADWTHGALVFRYFFPFGPVELPDGAPWHPATALGLLTLLPLAFAIVAALRPRGPADPIALRLGFAGLGVAVAFVAALWTLQRTGVAPVFHAPRYPALAAALWAAGLAGVAVWAVRRAGLRRGWAWAPMAAWLLAAAIGQTVLQRDEARRAFARRLTPAAVALLPPRGGTLYVFPSELRPYYRESLAAFDVRPIEELPCALPKRGEAAVLDLNVWRALDRPRDLIVRQAIASGRLAADVASARFPEPQGDYTLHRLRGVRADVAAELCARGLRPPDRPIPPHARAVALPEDQLLGDGWSFPEIGPDLAIRRWGSRETATVAFDRPLAPGEYVLHYHGYRTAFPRQRVTLELRLPGDDEVHRTERGEGGFELEIPFRLAAAVRHPRVSVTHPLWSPHDAAGSPDTRRLSSLLEYAWIEAAPIPRPRRASRGRDALAELRMDRPGLGAFSRQLP